MRRMFGTDPANKDYTSDHLRPALCAARRPGGGCRRQGRKIMQAGKARRSRVEIATQISADAHRRRDAGDGGDAGRDFRPAAAGDRLQRCRPSRSPLSTRATGRWRCTGSARTVPRATRCWRARFPAASPSTTACFISRKINQPMGGVGASGTGAYHGEWGFRTLSEAEAGVLSLAVQPARRSLSALWREDRAAGEADAVSVVGLFTPSLRANGSREGAPDDRLHEAIHRATKESMDCFVALRLAMTE